MGFPSTRAAVASAGSGPAMRSGIIGAFFADDPNARRAFVLASSRFTHRGWQAEVAALAIAEMVALTVQLQQAPPIKEVTVVLRSLCAEPEWLGILAKMETSLAADVTVSGFVNALGLQKGISGCSLHVAFVAIYAWVYHRANMRAALIAAIECGGDTDTVGAIVGTLCGATSGPSAIPKEWLDGVAEWPRSVAFMRRVASHLALQTSSGERPGPVRYCWPGILPRNAVFLAVVLFHGFRRMFPPF